MCLVYAYVMFNVFVMCIYVMVAVSTSRPDRAAVGPYTVSSAVGCVLDSISSVWSGYRPGSMGSREDPWAPGETAPRRPAATSSWVMDTLSVRVCCSLSGCGSSVHEYRPGGSGRDEVTQDHPPPLTLGVALHCHRDPSRTTSFANSKRLSNT